MCPRTSALWHGRAESRGAARTVRPGRRGAAEQELGWSMYRSACVSPWKAGGNKRGFPTPRHAPLRALRKGTDLVFGCDGGDTIAAPLFDPERLSHACSTMQFAVSSYLFPVICAVQQIVLIDQRGLERAHHFAGRWRTDVGYIDGFEDLGRIAKRLDLDCLHGCTLHRRCIERSRTKRVAEHGEAAL